ncbi:MAG: hypothetical protein U1F49_15460 [Rubrivivax sp.]
MPAPMKVPAQEAAPSPATPAAAQLLAGDVPVLGEEAALSPAAAPPASADVADPGGAVVVAGRDADDGWQSF